MFDYLIYCCIRFDKLNNGDIDTVGTMIPKKQANDDAGEAQMKAENIEPLVAFSRPPPIPPFLGPLVALSLLESWSRRDSKDD